jgi:hypothetical protein
MKTSIQESNVRAASRLLLTLLSIAIVACTSARFSGSQNKKKNNDSGLANSASGGTATAGEGSAGTATGGEETGGTATAGTATGGTTPTPTIPIDPATCKDSDFILPTWPPSIASCVDQGHIFNFDKNTCSKIPKASFACNWTQILLEEERVLRGKIPQDRIGSINREPWSKVVGCGEHEDSNYHILVLQYWTAKNEKDLEKCEMAAGWNIHTSCRIYKKSKDLSDLGWQNCLDYQP